MLNCAEVARKGPSKNQVVSVAPLEIIIVICRPCMVGLFSMMMSSPKSTKNFCITRGGLGSDVRHHRPDIYRDDTVRAQHSTYMCTECERCMRSHLEIQDLCNNTLLWTGNAGMAKSSMFSYLEEFTANVLELNFSPPELASQLDLISLQGAPPLNQHSTEIDKKVFDTSSTQSAHLIQELGS